MLSQQNSPEMAVKPTQTAPVPETTSPRSSAVSESPPASPSVENASEESVNAASASCRCQSRLLGPLGVAHGLSSFVAAEEASEEKIVASARDAAVTSRFAGKDLEDALVADDDDGQIPKSRRRRDAGRREGAEERNRR